MSDRIIEVLLVAHEQGTGVVLDLLRDLAETTTDDIRLLETIETPPELRRRRHVVLPVDLVVRESTAAPSKARNRARRARSAARLATSDAPASDPAAVPAAE